MPCLFFLILFTLFTTVPCTAAVIPVVDAGNIVQSTISAVADVETAIQAALEVVNSYTQIANQYTQIANQYQQIAHQATNLTQFNGSTVNQVLGMYTSITTTLGQAQGVSFHLSQAAAQFDALYPQVQGVMNAGAILSRRRQWVAHRRNAATTGMQMQAITQHLHTMATQMSQLLSQAGATQGNLAIQQVRAQQEGLTQALLMQVQQLLAGNGRLDAQRGAEEATVQEATLQAIEAATAPAAPYTGANGKLMTYRW